MGGDLGTKGLTFISPDDSPTGKALIAAACSESGTIAIYEFATHSAAIDTGNSNHDALVSPDPTPDVLDHDWLF